MAKAAAQKKKRVGAGLLTKVLVLVLAAGIGWQLYQLRDQVQSAQLQKETLAAQVQEKQQENDALSADIAQGSTQEKRWPGRSWAWSIRANGCFTIRATDRCRATRGRSAPPLAPAPALFIQFISRLSAVKNYRKEKQNTVWSLRLGAL